jgi:nucleotide-binding universal stress UspA family protein
MRRSIIAAVDGSREATEAARVAAWLALSLDRRLVLAHVVDDPPVFPYADRWLKNAQRRQADCRGADLLDEVADEIGEPEARRRLVLRGLLYGDVVDRLRGLCREEQTDLLVVGTRARGRLAHALLGSTAATIARRAVCPIVIVPPGVADDVTDPASEPRDAVVYGYDSSPAATRARLVATDLADTLGLRELSATMSAPSADDSPNGLPFEVASARAALTEAAERTRARLIVLGSDGRRVGLISDQVAASAGVPVVVVPPTARLPRFAERVFATAAQAA